MAIVGAGPAGAAAAHVLAPGHDVVLLEREAADGARIGESLVPACRPILADLGLFEKVVADGHAPYNGNISIWGAAQPARRDFLFDPDGAGLHLDRARFDGRLRCEAVANGAELMRPAALAGVDYAPGSEHPWRLAVAVAAGRRRVACRVLIDATGRSSHVARAQGAVRCSLDTLVSVYALSPERLGGGSPDTFTTLEAVRDGWWYGAQLPGGRTVLAFHTDGDDPALGQMQTSGGFAGAAGRTVLIGEILAWAGGLFGPARVKAANSSRLDRAAGTDWLAVGDAACAFDPLSSQGLFNALFTGLTGAQAIAARLAGDAAAFGRYDARIASVFAAYRTNLKAYYGLERRWPASRFWRRRQEAAPTAP